MITKKAELETLLEYYFKKGSVNRRESITISVPSRLLDDLLKDYYNPESLIKGMHFKNNSERYSAYLALGLSNSEHNYRKEDDDF